LAEETEVTNVGGDNGVASEVTLAKLVDAMEKIAAKTGADPKSQAAKAEKARTESVTKGIKVSTKHTDAVKKNTDAVNASTQAFKSLGSGLVKFTSMLSGAVFQGLQGFSEELFGASRNLSDFSRHIPFIGSSFSVLTGLIDETYDVFQDLSKSGAAFDYNLIELRNSAASARVSLSEFAGLITNNSEKLAAFGGTVDQGVKNITDLRDSMGSSLTERFERLGLTTEEINETLVYQQYLNRAGARTRRTTDEQYLQTTLSLTKNMTQLAKLTGQDVKVQQEKIAQAQMDVAFQRKLSKIDEDERRKLNAAMAEAQATGGDAAVEVLKSKFLGMPPLTEAAQTYTATQAEGAQLIKKNLDQALDSSIDYDRFMSQRESRMTDYGEAFASAANRLDGILRAEAAGLEGLGISEQMMQSQATFGTYIDETGRFVRDEFQKTFEGLSDEDAAGTGLAGAARFRTSLAHARNALQKNLVSPLQGVAAEVLDPLIESFKKFIGPQGSSTVFRESLETLRGLLENQVTPKIKDFFKAFAEDPKQAINDAFSDISSAMTNWFLGDLKDGERSGGFYDKHLAPLLQRLGTDLMQGAVGVIKDGLQNLFTNPQVIAGAVSAIGLLFGAGVVKTALANAFSNALLNRGGAEGTGVGRSGGGRNFGKGIAGLTALFGLGTGLFDKEKREAGMNPLDRASTGAIESLLGVLDLGANVTGNLTNSIFGTDFFGNSDLSGSYRSLQLEQQERINEMGPPPWERLFNNLFDRSSSLTTPLNPTSNPPLSASDIRSEMIDPSDADPLLAREAREQRARFADSMGNNSTYSASQSPTQDQSSAVINDLNTTMQQLRQTLTDIRTNTKKQLEATENIGTVN
jgi:hypothetical protein